MSLSFTPLPANANLDAVVGGLLVGGVQVVAGSVSYVGADGQGSVFVDGGDVIGLGSGLLLTSGSGSPATSNTSSGFSSNAGTVGDDDLTAAGGRSTFDANTLTFKILVVDPSVTSLTFNFVFGSEEYPEYTDLYPDIGAIIVNGVNYAFFANGQPLTVNTANVSTGAFQDNTGGAIGIEYDGISKPLSVTVPLVAGENTIKLGAADLNDHSLDSGLFIGSAVAGSDVGGGPIEVGGDSGAAVVTGFLQGEPPTLTGTATAGAGVRVYDGGAFIGEATADASGGWSLMGRIAAGTGHSFTATQVVGGVESGKSAPVFVGNGDGFDGFIGNAAGNHFVGSEADDYMFGAGFAADGSLLAKSGNDSLDGGGGNDGLWGGDGNDALAGGAGGDALVGGAGDDSLDGGAGDDFIFAGDFAADGSFVPTNGHASISGGDGLDLVLGGNGGDTIDAGAGDGDVVVAGSGHDSIAGGSGDNDFIFAGAGNDTVAGGAGDFDFLYAGAGADVFVFAKGDGRDTIWDFDSGNTLGFDPAEGDRLKLDPALGITSFEQLTALMQAVVLTNEAGQEIAGTKIVFAGGADQLDIAGVTPGQWQATMFDGLDA